MLAIRTVLFATDRSACAERARAFAERLAERHDADLHILYVAPDEAGVPLEDFELDPAEIAQDLRLPIPPRPEPREPQRLEVERRAAAPALGILAYAREVEADVIVMGTHGRRGVRRLVLGSVAAEVLRGASCPVLTVGPECDEAAEVRRILVPVDFSEHSQRALAHAKEIAGLFGARLDVLHVIEEVALPDAYGYQLIPIALGQVQARSREVLERLLQQAPGPEVPASIEVRPGYPALTIADYAAETGADLIVLSSHGRTGLRRLLIGSVAEQVLRLAPCPVFVVKSFGKRLTEAQALETEAEAL